MDSPARQRSILLIASLVSSLVMLDSNVVAVALPTIATSLGADFADMQWVITAYVLPFAALLLAAGSFGDKVGRRKAALLGQAIFAAASLSCGVATTPLMLNLSRALQGVGASLLLTAALAIINHSFQGAARARAYAFWGACLGIAITCGPIVGGLISSLFGWHWAFLINLPICAALIVGTFKVIPESRDPEAKRLDYAGVATFSSGLFLLTWAVIDGNALGWTAPAVLLRAAGGAALLAAFVAVERAQARPMVDFSLLRTGDFLGSTFSMIGYAGGAQVMIFYLPLFLQNAFGFAPARAGVAMLPFALPMFLVPRAGARLASRLSSRSILCLGLGTTAAANLLMAFLAGGRVSYLPFAVAMALAGSGAGLLNGETAKAMQSALPPQRAGMASGISGTVRFSALLFGVAGLGAVLLAATGRGFAAAASRWGLDTSAALGLARRFAAGDVSGVARILPAVLRDAGGTALRQAFESGFAVAASTAAGVALATLALTWLLMPAEERALGSEPILAVPGE
ncbi:MAG TPA: MFS transporter [Thermoanaerobaculia bacterium]|nr:MFS transporter [Thermoanaerobaculia bacterium]